MKSSHTKFAGFTFALLVSLVMASSACAQDEDDGFVPRPGSPPADPTTGASRTGGHGPDVLIVAPAKLLGMTSRKTPSVYWYISEDTKSAVKVSINDPKKKKTLVRTTINGPIKLGMHKLDLSTVKKDDKPVALEPGVMYEVVVTVAQSSASSSENPTATCAIMRLDPKDAPKDAADEKDLPKRAAIYAKAGVWFDYFDSLNSAIEAAPKDEKLIAKRTKALEAQGLIWKPDGTITEKETSSK